jgi:hypothetical protein
VGHTWLRHSARRTCIRKSTRRQLAQHGCQGSTSHVRRDLQSDCGRAAQGSQKQLRVSVSLAHKALHRPPSMFCVKMSWCVIFHAKLKNVPASAKAQLLRRGTLSAATRQWSACWAHNPKFSGLTPGSAILLDIHAYGSAFAGSSRRTGCQGSKSHVRRDLQCDCGRAAQGSQKSMCPCGRPRLQQRFALANPGVPLLRTRGGEDREGRGGEDSRGGEIGRAHV